MTVPLLHLITPLDLTAEAFAWRLAPASYQAGALSCACYEVTGGGLLGLFERPSRAWPDLPPPGPSASFDQHLIAPNAAGASVRAAWIAVFRFTVEDEADDALIAALGAHQPLMAASGLIRLRYATGGPGPRCLVLAEWDQPPPDDTGIPDVLFTAAGEGITDDSALTARRLYPWP